MNTPRTDAEVEARCWHPAETAMADFARQLERELRFANIIIENEQQLNAELSRVIRDLEARLKV